MNKYLETRTAAGTESADNYATNIVYNNYYNDEN